MLQKWYDNFLAGLVDQQSSAVRSQVGVAIQCAPQKAAEVDKWFDEHLKKEPVAHNTALYNALHAAKDELKKMLADAEKPAKK